MEEKWTAYGNISTEEACAAPPLGARTSGSATDKYLSHGLFFFSLIKHCYHGLCIQLQY